MKDFELQMRLRNNRIKARRLELGLTPMQLSEMCGVGYATVLEYEGMRLSPSTRAGNEDPWRKSARKLAAFFGCSCEELWPEEILAVQNPVVTVEVDATQLAMLAGAESLRLASPSPEQTAIEHNLIDQVRRALKTLTPREEKVLRMRFGIGSERLVPEAAPEHTFKEIGDLFERKHEAIRQIEAQALAKLRRHSRAKQLRAFVDPEYDECQDRMQSEPDAFLYQKYNDKL